MTHAIDPVTVPVETKTKAATLFAYLGSVALLAVLSLIDEHRELLSGLPDWATTLVGAALPTVVAFVASWRAKHTPRPDLRGEVIDGVTVLDERVGQVN
jgi:hypothetical protein